MNRRSLVTAGGLLGLTAAGALAGGTSAAAATSAARHGEREQRRGRLELVLLGTQAGPVLMPDRAGIATALVVDGHTYLVDCGRAAASQFVRAGLPAASLEAVFLTHLHVDHTADYYNMLLFGSNTNYETGDTLGSSVRVYGPSKAGGLPPTDEEFPTIAPENPDPGTAEMTRRLHEAYAYSTNVFLRDMDARDMRSLIDVREIDVPSVGANYLNRAPSMEPFTVMEDERVRVTAVLVPHGPVFPAFAFRFDTAYGSVTFSGDTTYSDNLLALAQDSDVLVHEAMNLTGGNLPEQAREHMLQSHVEVQKVGPIARRAGARHLVLSHIADVGKLEPQQWDRWARRGFSGRVTVGEDLQRIVVA